MKRQLALASSMVLLAACGPSREALQALDAMRILQDSPNAGISYRSLSGSGNDLTLKDVQVMAPEFLTAMAAPPVAAESADAAPAPAAEASPPTPVLNARTMTLKGLTMKDGKPLARDIVLNDLTPAAPTGPVSVTLGSLGVEGMNDATGRFIAGLVGMAQENEPPALEQWQFGKAGFGGLKVTGDIPLPAEEGGESAEARSGKINVEFGEISFADMKDAMLGRLRLSGFKGDFDFPVAPNVAGTFDFGTFDVSNIRTKMLIDPFVAAFASIQSGEPVDYASLYSNYTSPLETGSDRTDWTGARLNVSGLNFTASELHTVHTRNADGVVVATDTPRFSMKFTADDKGGALGAMGLMMLAMAGYDSHEVEVFTQGAATFDPARDLTRWNSYSIGVTDLFDIQTTGGIVGLRQALPTLMTGLMKLTDSLPAQTAALGLDGESPDEDADEASPPGDGDESDQDESDAPGMVAGDSFGGLDPAALMSLVMGLMPLQITDFDIAITDKKLLNMILENQAIDAGQTVEQFRADLVAMVSASSVFMTDAGLDAAIAQELSAAAAGFLSGPGTLRIQLKPKQPLGVMSAFAMPLTKDSLGFSATFTPVAPVLN